ncbi:proline dehydrogenase family protein [Natrialbaceae archaeon A-arb3/5]
MLPPVANRFIAGETAAEAVEYARHCETDGLVPMLNRLGSHHREREQAYADAAAYRLLLDDLADAGLDAAISIKPTQLGLESGYSVFRELLDEVVAHAVERDIAVWLDMEEHPTVDPTLAAATDLAAEHGSSVGVCVQADLHRTRDDLARLAETPTSVRLVKGGAYDRPDGIAYTDPERIDQAYRNRLEDAFERFDEGLAVATHDPAMIERAATLADRHGTDFEIQMLMGVRPVAQRELALEHDVSQFIPYGERWKRWALNRAKRNLAFTARAIAESAVSVRSAGASVATRD